MADETTMRVYARIECGKVVDMRAAENRGFLARVFGSDTFWEDVTNRECAVGYLMQYVEGAGVIPVNPASAIILPDVTSLEEAKEIQIAKLGVDFAKERDRIRWVELSPAVLNNGETITYDELFVIKNLPEGVEVVTYPIRYGFDCAAEDITNFMAAFTPLLMAQAGTCSYKVWVDDTNKSVVELSFEDMQKVYNEVRYSQLQAYDKYQILRAQIEECETVEAVVAITW